MHEPKTKIAQVDTLYPLPFRIMQEISSTALISHKQCTALQESQTTATARPPHPAGREGTSPSQNKCAPADVVEYLALMFRFDS